MNSLPADFISAIPDSTLQNWLRQQITVSKQSYSAHGDSPRWFYTLAKLSVYKADDIDLSRPRIQLGSRQELDDANRSMLKSLLLDLHPWRKGPFSVFGVHVDSEWQSDKKWSRLQGHIAPLQGRHVLDIGCGNGYYMLRMLGEGAAWVLGIDPTILFNMQFKALTQFCTKPLPACLLPVGIEQLPDKLNYFDTVFSMGVLYHRRSPIDHLYKLLSCLRPGGELVLETLVIEGPDDQLLLPSSRYAKMRNVWFIPTAEALKSWLQRCGFLNVRILDVTATLADEQRSTEWMRFESLSDFLDPDDRTKTIEGHPAPVRTLIVAEKPI